MNLYKDFYVLWNNTFFPTIAVKFFFSLTIESRALYEKSVLASFFSHSSGFVL
jgi:hypothetical protein